MANSLLTGISGLRGHQKMLEVVGNNLANINTTAFKSSRVLFSDLMFEIARRGTSSSASGELGSVNAAQIGTGVRLAQVDANFQQGNLESTGNDLDLGIEGGGFFVTASPEKTFFTRAGAFALDEGGYLADPATGFRVMRFGSVGEVATDVPAFQTPGDDRIYVPIGGSIPGRVSNEIGVKGNLNSTSTGPIAQELKTAAALESGSNPATLTTFLKDLDNNLIDYVSGDKILFAGRKSDGTNPDVPQMNVDATTTVGDLISALNSAFPDATVSLDTDGNIVATANATGPSFLFISFADSPSNTGQTDFTETEMVVTKEGKHEDSFTRAVEVYDETGASHSMSLTFTKQANSSWTINANVLPIHGTVIDGLVEGITFQPNGSFNQVTGTGLGDANISVQFAGTSSPQVLTLSFGSPSSFEGLTSLGSATSMELTPDGFPPGEISEVQIDTDGTVFGLASNGLKVPLAQLAIASFQNVDGLISVGQNYFTASLASGNPEVGTAISGNRGSIRSGQLEVSNVDLALEFTRLIIAQRGFSANARTITVTDEILEELTNIIR